MSSDEEVQVNEATGAKKARNLQRGSLIPATALLEIANHYGTGSLKYDDNNWRKGYAWSWSYDSLVRHMAAFWDGEDYDAETKSKHIIAAAWHCIALATFMDEHPELDDRWSTVLKRIKETNDQSARDAEEGNRRGRRTDQGRPWHLPRPHWSWLHLGRTR